MPNLRPTNCSELLSFDGHSHETLSSNTPFVFLFCSFRFSRKLQRQEFHNPITDVCWSCVFPIKLGGVTLSSGNNADPETDANRLCLCASGANITVGLNMSFWEPLRTAEVVRTPYCFPSLGGLELNVGIRAPAHGRTPNKSTSAQRSSFYQVHWYFTPWLFILEVLLDTKCLEQSAWDLAYMTELDPLWDDSVTTFFLNPVLRSLPIRPQLQPAPLTAWRQRLPFRFLNSIGVQDATAESFP